jgi:MFS family permease
MFGYDYNLAITIFYISYILFEIPLNAICKWVGPGWFIPFSCLGFAVCTIITGFVSDFPSFCGIRFMLGVFESASVPAISYYLSRWYRRSELTFRISLFIVAASLSGAFGGLLASAILTLDRVGSITSWRMIFVIEGMSESWAPGQLLDLHLIFCFRCRYGGHRHHGPSLYDRQTRVSQMAHRNAKDACG